MQLRFTQLALALSLLSAIGIAAAAEKISGKADILGSWSLTGTSPALNEPKRNSTEQWEFKEDGTFTLSSIEHRVNGKVESQSKYEVADGKIKIERPGRPGKFYIYEVHSKNGADMVLKGGLEGFYYLKKN